MLKSSRVDGSSVSEKYSFHTSTIQCDDRPSCSPVIANHPFSDSASLSHSNAPPPFSAHNFSPEESANRIKLSVAEPDSSPPPPFAPAYPTELQHPTASELEVATKAGFGSTKEGESSTKSAEEKEPPPPYTEGSSPLGSFTYVMAAAGGPASIITQVPQEAPRAPGGQTIAGTKFVLSRDELLTLPEFVLLSLFPNGLLPDGHMNSFHEGDTYPVDYDPASLQYMLDFFRTVAQTIPSSSPSPTTDTPSTDTNVQGSARDMLQDRAGIIVLREDLDFYAIPPKADIDQPEMIEVKRAAGRALLKQDGIFSGLRKSEEAGTTEQHLIEMLTAGLALARLRTDIKGNDLANSNAVGMAQKLLLFWRKPARRCWWEGVELDNVEGIEGKLKVWIRRVWTLEMSGVHKFACLALFRALLRQSRQLLPDNSANLLRKHVIADFRTYAKTRNQAVIRAALTTGYGVLEDLTIRKSHVLRQIPKLSSQEKVVLRHSDKGRASMKDQDSRTVQPKSRPVDTGRRWPHPDAQPVLLAGLAQPPSGRGRRIPSMVNANHIPILRFKKPQSPFLSHMIRQKNDEREKRIDRTQRLENLLPLAEDEDRWDAIVRRMTGFSSINDTTQWATATREALFHVKKLHNDSSKKRMHIAQRMFEIMQKEKKKAYHEKLLRRDQRHQAYKARRRQKEALKAAECLHPDEAMRAVSAAAT
ncbi:MAG: hypothetical protein L6R40_002538 [Gallowayella cf. fulva]|nr:MAG: hypothetical protein L6R40_002538 [Xanthomendoza cf. fulva]